MLPRSRMPARAAAALEGRLAGEMVECGYHGLTFDCSGTCVRAPTQDGPPPAVTVRSYPVEDRWGILWIWMGDANKANPDKIFEIPNYDNPAWGRTQGGSMDIACHYLYVVDNLLDPSHVAWVHVSSLPGPQATCHDLEKLDDGIIVSRWVMDAPPRPTTNRSCLSPAIATASSITNAACPRPRSTCGHRPETGAKTKNCRTKSS